MSLQIQIRQNPVPLATAPQYLAQVNADNPLFAPLWQQFLDAYPLYSFRYRSSVQEYYKMISGPEAVDLSFVVKNDAIPLAICPLVIENIDGWVQGSLSRGGFLPVPLFHPQLGAKQIRALEAQVFEEAARRLRAHQAQRWLVDADPVSVDTDQLEDLLPARFGALDISIQCHIMDLTLPDDEIWLQIRHSAKSIINQGLRTYEFKVYDRGNYTPEIGERHRLLHHKCSGRITRPIPTFHKMYSWVHEDGGLMFEQLHQGQTVQMIFVALGKGAAAGASAADDPDFQGKVPLTHSMNHFIYQEVKKRGIKYFEVGGTTFRDSLYYMRTRKARAVDVFKRSFGRQALPWKRWLWFPTAAAELRYLEEEMVKYRRHVTETYSGPAAGEV